MAHVLSLRELITGTPRYRAITAWGPGAALLAMAGMAAAIVCLQVVSLWLAARVLGAEAFNAQVVGTGLEAPVMLLSTLLTQVPLIAMVWIAAGRGGLRAETLQFAQPPLSWAACVAAGVALAGGLGCLLTAFQFLLPGFSVVAETRAFETGLQSPLWWGTVLAIGVLGPISEELAFRGLLLTALAKSRLGLAGGGLISNLLWAAPHVHYSLPALATVLLGGVVLTWLVWRTGSIRAAIVAHIVANCSLLAYLAFSAPVSAA